jgi:hypothetical protein
MKTLFINKTFKLDHFAYQNAEEAIKTAQLSSQKCSHICIEYTSSPTPAIKERKLIKKILNVSTMPDVIFINEHYKGRISVYTNQKNALDDSKNLKDYFVRNAYPFFRVIRNN